MLHAASTPRRATLSGRTLAGLVAALLLCVLTCAAAVAQRPAFDRALTAEGPGLVFPSAAPARTVRCPTTGRVTDPTATGRCGTA
jgi:hypothetical protein